MEAAGELRVRAGEARLPGIPGLPAQARGLTGFFEEPDTLARDRVLRRPAAES